MEVIARTEAMISTAYVTTLYQRYAGDLKAVRRQQYWFRWRHDNELIRVLGAFRNNGDGGWPGMGYVG